MPCECNVSYLKTPSAILKIFEMVSIAVTMGLFRGVPLTFGIPGGHFTNIGSHADFFANGALVAGMIITPMLFIVYLAGFVQIQRTALEMTINFVLAILFFISGSAGLAYWHDPPEFLWEKVKTEGLVMSMFCYVCTAFYLLDSLWSVRLYCCAPKAKETTEPANESAA